MKDIYKEEDINNFVDSFAKKTTEKLKEDLLNDFYGTVHDYIYEHYNNFKDDVERELINSITEKYKKDPKDYKFSELRKKMFVENKEEITKVLTDEAIYESVEKVIEQYTHKDYRFNWRWKEGIVKIIWENWHKFKDDEKIKNGFDRIIDRQKERITFLENKLIEIKNESEY